MNEIKNWHLFTEVFGEKYTMHDTVIKRFDLNGDELTVVVNTLYKVANNKVYDITMKFSRLIRFDYDTEIGDDYIDCIEVKKDDFYKNLFVCVFDGVMLSIECFEIELLSVTESESFQRGMISLNDPNQTGGSGTMRWRG